MVDKEEVTQPTLRRLISRNRNVKIIGIYGMGGVGKTTLLTEIKGEMGTHFDMVIMVSLWEVRNTESLEYNIFKIQVSIGDHLGNFQLAGEEEGRRARFLSSALSGKNVLLLLDNLWEKVDLDRVGIPGGNSSSCKVVFTTRSKEVCIAMNAQERFKAMPLPESKSWELFSSQISDSVGLKNNPSIEALAREVVAKCGGLPLTLVTIGRAMENATPVEEWKKAIKKLKSLKNSPYRITQFRGMRKVLQTLKLSYNRLRNDSLRWCFLYCVAYPKGRQIYAPEIISYWVGEGLFLGGEIHPESVVEELISACLLEDCGNDYVKMHVGIHDMASWVISSSRTNVIFSYAGLGLTHWPMEASEKWGEAIQARLISLMYNNIKTFPDNLPVFPNLISLLINDNPSLKKPIPESFFRSMPHLRSLDLSNTGIEEIPKSIGLLVQLRYLNLSDTNICSLPEEMGNLQSLRHLRLCRTDRLGTIPRQEILKLSSLQTLDLSYSKYIWDASEDISIDNTTAAEDLEAFTQLEDLGITIATSRFLQVLLSSHSWSNAIWSLSLQVKDLTISHLSTVSESMKRLSNLQICNALELEELTLESGQFLNLDTLRLLDLPMLSRIIVLNKNGQVLPDLLSLEIGKCNLLRDINWVHKLKSLKDIALYNCNGLEELLLHGCKKGDETDRLTCNVPNLMSLKLGWLPNLRSISRSPLLLPSLEIIHVYGCPKLMTLPFGLRSAEKIKKIMGSQRWWDGLVWKPDNIKATFLPHFTHDGDDEDDGDECDDDDEGDDVDNDDEGDDGEDTRKRKRRRQ